MSRMGSRKTGRRPRRQFTDEFKAGAVRLVLDEGRPVAAVAREFPDVRWDKELVDAMTARMVMRPASIDTVVFDVARKPALRPYRAGARRAADESPSEYGARCAESIAADPNGYYQQIEVSRSDSDMQAFLEDAWSWWRAMKKADSLSTSPRNPEACFTFGAPCAYLPVCQGQADLYDPTKYRHVPPKEGTP